MNKFINSSKSGDELLFISHLGRLYGWSSALLADLGDRGELEPRALERGLDDLLGAR